jgi:MFS family permease
VAAKDEGVDDRGLCVRGARAAVWLLGVSGGLFGLSTPMLFSVGAALAGPRAAGRWAGAQNLAGQLAGIVAPVVTGFIVDSAGAFTWAFAAASMFAVLALVAWGLVIRKVVQLPWPEGFVPAPVTPVAAQSGAA